MSRITVSPLLRFALRLDAAASAATGLALSLFGGRLQDLLGLPHGLLLGAGVFCLAYAAMIGWMAVRAHLPRAGVWAVIVGNLGWSLGCALLAFEAWLPATAVGVAFLVAQAAAVFVFAELQYFGLRRSGAATAAA